MEFANIKWEDIQNALKDNEIAVEFVMSKEGKTQYYSAEVIRKSYDSPKHVFLFGLRDNDSITRSGKKSQTSPRRVKQSISLQPESSIISQLNTPSRLMAAE